MNLQKGPDGLLGALDLKTTGQNPQEFPGSLLGTFDCVPFYLLRNRTFVTGSGPFATVGTIIVMTGGVFTVPQAEVWRVKAISAVLLRNVADIALNIELVVGLRRMGAASATGIFTPRFEPVAATDLTQARAALGMSHFWLGPGDTIEVRCRTTITAAASAIGVSVDYDTMPSG